MGAALTHHQKGCGCCAGVFYVVLAWVACKISSLWEVVQVLLYVGEGMVTWRRP